MAFQAPDKNNRLADYFVICGLDPSGGLELETLSSDEAYENLAPLERPYRSRLLAHYPEDVVWNPFDEKAIRMLCMPAGLTFRTEKHITGPKYHTFIVTREDGSRCFGYALIMFEEVKDSNICCAIRTLQEMHLAEVTLKRHQYVGKASYTSSLPRSMKLGSRKLSLAEDTSDGSLYDMAKDKLFVSKCIAYVSQHQFMTAFRYLLLSLHERYRAPAPHELPVESYVFNVLYEISAPNLGQSSRFYFYPDSHFLLQRPSDQEIPLFEYSLRAFFGLFGVDTAVDLITCALLEHQILLCSKDHFLLVLVAESVTNLLFPFSWQHVYVPILPDSMQMFLDAPVPFIMGLHRRDVIGDMPRTEGNVCFVDIDAQKVRMPEDIPCFPDRTEFIRELKDVIKCYGATLNIDYLRQRVQHKDRGFQRKYSLTDLTEAGCFKDSGQTKNVPPVTPYPSRMKMALQPKSNNSKVGYQGAVGSYGDENGERLAVKKTSKLNAIEPSTLYAMSYVDDMKFNNAVREVFVNRFVQIFYSYEHFVLHAGKDLESWKSNRDSVHTFDKTTFLSDQPDTHVPFLSPFLETQMFATFVDCKILSSFGEISLAVRVFDSRIEKLKDQVGDTLVRAVKYQPCSTVEKSESALIQRVKRLDTASPKPGKLTNFRTLVPDCDYLTFPFLDEKLMNPESEPTKRLAINTKKKENASPKHVPSDPNMAQRLNRPRLNTYSSVMEMTPSMIATENWDFVDKLLKECKIRTKKMLVEKLSKEAVELGHNEGYVTGVEENTQIASLCDLLERVWSHGLYLKQGKSSLWSHLLYYQQRHERSDIGKRLSDVAETSPAFAWQVLRKRLEYLTAVNVELQSHSNLDSSRGRSMADRDLVAGNDCTPSLIFDMKNVLAMPELKSALGYARAWVRLSLEKKLLAKHLKELLSDGQLLETLYKRYAFLRNEDEREQFLYHLLSLNAVDFYCFTNTFTTTLVPYRVIISPSRKYSSSVPSSFWICTGGTLGDSGNVSATKSNLQMVFQRKNIGLLTTVRIGLDKTALNVKWLIDHIIVRNEVTGHMAKFPCGRWLGRGVDDGSVERLLVAEYAPTIGESHSSANISEYSTLPRTPQRCRSPSANRKSNELRFTTSEIQQMLGDSANSIVKYFFKPDKERGSMTMLLCGEMGLIFCIEQALMHGYSPLRLLRQPYLWSVFEKTDQFFRTELLGKTPMTGERHENVRMFCRSIGKINRSLHSLGKDGKFQVFAAISLRDRMLHKWLELISTCPIVDTMYERDSFIRDPILFRFMIAIIRSLDDYKIVLEPSLTKGIEL
ncbi:DENN domain-containing protein 5B-like isoform X2 [Paramacrobiotus metropolitanus]|uniref:DENN domain-containing protein 5B-like isoform X2 n=1 Tax=Paramacrobiotus metropolitanus TaxID=2943436 RepID=UPI002445B8B4|nr:DENN domain-containing protein 5B-like isoform X2 [Paramacrobiotus metropolitanus]